MKSVLGKSNILSIFLEHSLRFYSSLTNNTLCFWNGCSHPHPSLAFFQRNITISHCNQTLKFFLCAATWFWCSFIYHLNILHFSFWPWNKECVALDRQRHWHYFPVHLEHVSISITSQLQVYVVSCIFLWVETGPPVGTFYIIRNYYVGYESPEYAILEIVKLSLKYLCIF